MKKFLVIMIMSFIIPNTAYALSGARENIEYQSCYSNTINDGESASFAKAYCKCFANKLDRKYTDKQLDKLVSKGNNHMMSKIRPLAKKCFDSAKKITKSGSQSSGQFSLICYMNDPNSAILSPFTMTLSPKENWYTIKSLSVIDRLQSSSDLYKGSYVLSDTSGKFYFSFYIDRSTGAITYKVNWKDQERYYQGVCQKTSSGKKF